MKTFDYLVRNLNGMHVRPCVSLVDMVNHSGCKVKVMKNMKRTANAGDLDQLIRINVCCGDRVTVTVEGEDEDNLSIDLEEFFEANF